MHPPASCVDCGTELAPALLLCPACRTLVHRDELKSLAAAADDASARGDLGASLDAWRRALELLPPGTRQREQVAARIATLSSKVSAGPRRAGWGKVAAGGGIAGLLFKLKWILGFLLGQGKVLLLGLTKASTAFSMILSFGAYWSVFGWKFAAGLVGSIYIHEMGHVVALRRYGVRATAPMFIPGVGAVVRLRQSLATPVENARVGMAGPIYGLAAALGAYAAWRATGAPILGVIARVGAWINLFNLLPIGPLDGGRAFGSLARGERFVAVGVLLAAFFLSGESLLLLLIVVAFARAASPAAPGASDRTGLLQYAGCVVALTALSTIATSAVAPVAP